VMGMHAKNAQPTFAGISTIAGALLEDKFGKAAKQFLPGVIASQVVPSFESDEPFAKGFRTYLEKYYPETKLSFVTFEGYIVGRLFAMAAKLAGPEPTTESLIAAIESMHDVQFFTGAPIKFGSTEHQGSRRVWLSTWNDDLELIPLATSAD